MKQAGDNERSNVVAPLFIQKTDSFWAPTVPMVDIARYNGGSNACMLLSKMWRHSDRAVVRNNASAGSRKKPTLKSTAALRRPQT
ncbi:hypothetical protein CQ10_09435 [Bradyrhizobium valentinum]|nr:hypothetical protein CQ10_09435 [Bradyrhizobium valentinum]